MGKLRSLLIRVELDAAKRSHRCQANSRHEIKQGDQRLNVRAGRGWDRYCMDCARKIVDGSIASLTGVSKAMESGKTATLSDNGDQTLSEPRLL
ncbi:hypothetical protein BE61_74310 [Bradyrhizobium elkanii USDA 61]|nr:hypothetical protein BE61_74310 [Bradyrhizobium elkanii USDA 61]